MIAIPAVAFYQVVLAVHIAAVVLAFGVTFAYPIIFAIVEKPIRVPCQPCTAPNWPSGNA